MVSRNTRLQHWSAAVTMEPRANHLCRASCLSESYSSLTCMTCFRTSSCVELGRTREGSNFSGSTSQKSLKSLSQRSGSSAELYTAKKSDPTSEQIRPFPTTPSGLYPLDIQRAPVPGHDIAMVSHQLHRLGHHLPRN
jgi:hypothetical protein